MPNVFPFAFASKRGRAQATILPTILPTALPIVMPLLTSTLARMFKLVHLHLHFRVHLGICDCLCHESLVTGAFACIWSCAVALPSDRLLLSVFAPAAMLRLLKPRLVLFGHALAQRTFECDAQCVPCCASKQEGRCTGDYSANYSTNCSA